MTPSHEQISQKKKLDAKDGVAMGHACLLKIKEEEKKRPKGGSVGQFRVSELFKSHRPLKELARLHPSFHDMMIAIVRNKVWKSPEVKTELINLRSREGQHIGGGLSLALITNTAPESGVDEWIYRYPALIELDDKFVWFRPMQNVVGKKVLATSNTGAKYKAFSGAGLSVRTCSAMAT